MSQSAKELRSRYFTELQCVACGAGHGVDLVDPRCERCDSVLEARYDLGRVAAEVRREEVASRRGMWRWNSLLPIDDVANAVSLGEGDTPLRRISQIARLGRLGNVHVKEEGRNPTDSFKARGASTTVSRTRELGIESLILASSGNAASAFAVYSALSGHEFVALIRKETSTVHRLLITIAGSKAFDVEGDMADGTALAGVLSERLGHFHCTQPYNLYRVEGKKTVGFEVSEALGWRVPDRYVVPTAGGTMALALYKAYRELNELGWVDGMPAIDIVQAAGCAPIVKAWRSGSPVEPWGPPRTKWVGLGHPFPGAGDRVVEVMRRTGGYGWTVHDNLVLEAERLLASREGIFVQPASAAPLAALLSDDAGRVGNDELIVLIATGAGHNQSVEPLAMLEAPPRVPADADLITHLIEAGR